MSLPRALVKGPLRADAEVTLDGEAFHHLAHVRRLVPGDLLILFDGLGCEARAEVTAVEGDRLRVRLSTPRQATLAGPEVTLLCAETKGEKLDHVLRQATELGVARFVPVITFRSVVRPTGEARERRQKRRRRVAQQACAQCGRAAVPEVLEDRPVETALTAHRSELSILLWEDPDAPISLGALLRQEPIPGSVTLVIGPEGGFAPQEVEAARQAGYRLAGLGRLTLRSETAAIAALALVRMMTS